MRQEVLLCQLSRTHQKMTFVITDQNFHSALINQKHLTSLKETTGAHAHSQLRRVLKGNHLHLVHFLPASLPDEPIYWTFN